MADGRRGTAAQAVSRFVNEVLLNRDLEDAEVLEAAERLFSPDYALHDAPKTSSAERGPGVGADLALRLRRAFDGLEVEISSQVEAERGGLVTTRFVARGFLKEKGQAVSATGIALSRARRGKIEESWVVYDPMDLFPEEWKWPLW